MQMRQLNGVNRRLPTGGAHTPSPSSPVMSCGWGLEGEGGREGAEAGAVSPPCRAPPLWFLSKRTAVVSRTPSSVGCHVCVGLCVSGCLSVCFKKFMGGFNGLLKNRGAVVICPQLFGALLLLSPGIIAHFLSSHVSFPSYFAVSSLQTFIYSPPPFTHLSTPSFLFLTSMNLWPLSPPLFWFCIVNSVT